MWIRIRGSIPLTNEPGSGFDPDPFIFIIDLQDANKKQILKKFSAYYFLKVLLHHFLKVKKKSQNSRNQGFSYYFLLNDRRIRIRIQEAQKHVDPADPDPQH
jgi:hypothetical protein